MVWSQQNHIICTKQSCLTDNKDTAMALVPILLIPNPNHVFQRDVVIRPKNTCSPNPPQTHTHSSAKVNNWSDQNLWFDSWPEFPFQTLEVHFTTQGINEDHHPSQYIRIPFHMLCPKRPHILQHLRTKGQPVPWGIYSVNKHTAMKLDSVFIYNLSSWWECFVCYE